MRTEFSDSDVVCLALHIYLYLHFTEPIDREMYTELRFNIDVEDRGVPPNKNTVPVMVKVNDVNDNSPEIKSKFYNTEASFEVDLGMTDVILFIHERAVQVGFVYTQYLPYS